MIYDTRVANLQMDLATLTAMSTEYQEIASRTSTSTAKKTEVQGKIQALKAQIDDIGRTTSTYEKEFLDRKQGAPTYKRLQTLQDVVLAAFFFSYFLISLAAVFYIWRTSAPVGALMYAGTTAFIMTVLGIVLGELIRRYA
jgi:hypothetical protein